MWLVLVGWVVKVCVMLLVRYCCLCYRMFGCGALISWCCDCVLGLRYDCLLVCLCRWLFCDAVVGGL